MLFWIIVIALAAAVALILGLAALRARAQAQEAADYDLKVYRDQLREVERDLARGVIGEEDAERLRTEVSRRILAADAAAKAAARGETAQPRWAGPAVVAAVALTVVGGGTWLYLDLGAPGYPDQALADRIADAEEARQNRPRQAEAEAGLPAQPPGPQPDEDYLELMERLRAALEERPDDVRGFMLLARNEAALGNFKAAYEAQERVLALRGDGARAQDYADYAEMLVMAAGGYVSPEAEAALAAALNRDPQNAVARYYLGLMFRQTGRPDRAFATWNRLLRESAPDAPWVPALRAQLPEVAARAGRVNYELPEPAEPAPLPGPTAEQMEQAQDMSEEERMAMIRGMVDGLSQRLAEQGGTASEWARLIGALGVLGETEQAQAIYDEALVTFAGDEAALARIRAAAEQAGLGG
ncbi:c-type cytochrome biogenesis protein CcmI [Rhodosalinus halophilus]|uniref:C-type cytochrome biogenesis protein CcmI n=1 Tax=Rhodosalinus halophilus TaxID=2259333 RepID=A0A365U4R6_9RHOB|nr:c-type cytochrome biogenesis protein CcmI [Rhodosalinus halophilus]RBI83241.1 c-type cytochrome biogenesis protein CcmI [Rhodosalinus halophilus]